MPEHVIAAILAGGLGTRLRRVIGSRPKALAQVCGRPFLTILLSQLQAAGFETVVLCTGHLADQVSNCVESRWGLLKLIHSVEASPLGTGGALREALPLLSSSPILVLNGDSYYSGQLTSFIKWHTLKKAEISLLLARVDDARRFGAVDTGEGGLVRSFREKEVTHCGPAWVNAGVYLLSRTAIQRIPKGRQFSLERDLFPSYVGKGLYGYRGKGRFIDIGTPESYARASSFFATRNLW